MKGIETAFQRHIDRMAQESTRLSPGQTRDEIYKEATKICEETKQMALRLLPKIFQLIDAAYPNSIDDVFLADIKRLIASDETASYLWCDKTGKELMDCTMCRRGTQSYEIAVKSTIFLILFSDVLGGFLAKQPQSVEKAGYTFDQLTARFLPAVQHIRDFIQDATYRREGPMKAAQTRKNGAYGKNSRLKNIFEAASKKWKLTGDKYLIPKREWHDIVAGALESGDYGVSDKTLYDYKKRMEKLLQNRNGVQGTKVEFTRK
jgi:hypothetical protein